VPRRYLIDDVDLSEDEDKGPPIRFTNQELRQMLALAKAGPKDTYLDLGCGWGQTLIVALTEFNVSKAIGIEKDSERKKRCVQRLAKWERKIPALRGRWEVIEGDFYDLLEKPGRLPGVTLVFYGLSADKWLAEDVGKHLDRRGRLAYYFNGLIPEIMPDVVDFPFYVSQYPFRRPENELQWLASVIRKRASTLKPHTSPDAEELWEELSHDSDAYGNTGGARDYRRRLRAITAKTASKD
jgi:precorrin-6B methylase 2